MNKKIMICGMMVMLSIIAVIQIQSSNAVPTHGEQEFYKISQMPETQYFEQYEELAAPEKTVVIYPILTQSAYSWGSIHDFYSGRCETCSTASINEFYDPIFSVGAKTFRILEFLGYNIIDDIDIDKNPEILQDYNSIVVLHNEFVTENEFMAITSHSNVVYLYPGALTSKVEINYEDNSMSLKRGPTFPEPYIKNGFDWKHDNSKMAKNTVCEKWQFYKISNGHMLNCTPEDIIQNNSKLLKELKKLVTVN